MKKFILSFLLFIPALTFCSQNWLVSFIGQPSTLRAVYFINTNTGFIAGDRIFIKTSNGGVNWSINPVRFNLNSIYFVDTQTGYAAGKSNDSGFVLKTIDGGNSWASIYLNKTAREFKRVFFINSTTGYLVYPDSGYYRTTNGGLFWVFKRKYPDAQTLRDVKWIGSTFYQIGTYSSLPAYWTSTDEESYETAQVCAECSSPEDGFSYFSFAKNRYFISKYKHGTRYYIRKSSIGSPTWVQIGYGDESTSFLEFPLSIVNQSSLYYGFPQNSKSIFHATTNSGSSWNSDTLPDFTVKDLMFINTSVGYAVGTNGQIAKTTNGGGTIGVNTISTSIPHTFTLSQNYPNPFNPITKITFAVPKHSNVKLAVYNLLGVEVEMLVNENLSPGIYETTFNSSSHASGIYFYKIESNNFSQTKKMVVTK